MCYFLGSSSTREPNPKNRGSSVPKNQEPDFSVPVLSVPIPGSFSSVLGSRFFLPRASHRATPPLGPSRVGRSFLFRRAYPLSSLTLAAIDRRSRTGEAGRAGGRDGTKTSKLCNRSILLYHNKINLVLFFMHYNQLITGKK
jgi:hypothetical protein